MRTVQQRSAPSSPSSQSAGRERGGACALRGEKDRTNGSSGEGAARSQEPIAARRRRGRACAVSPPPAAPGRDFSLSLPRRHGAAARVARPAPPPRSLLRRARPAAPPAGRSLPENPPQQSAGLRHRGRIPPGEAAAGAEGVGRPQWGRAERPRRGAGAAGAGGLRGLWLRPQLPLQRVGGVALPPPAESPPPLPHPAFRGAHGDRAAGVGGLRGAAGGPALPPRPPRPGHPPAGGESAHHHPQPAPPSGCQPPAGPHGAALGGLRGAALWGGPRPNLHLPPGNGGSPPGLDLRRLGRLQRAPAGPGALLWGGPAPQRGLSPPPNQGAPRPSPLCFPVLINGAH